ncbi:DUF924 family protein [Saliniramus fredricksonii]|uniref:DUF924 family protein n=1 Tax=Saliniramus fredricksonii TaxID=1653334 RepID=UPI001EEDC1D2|nr:DUF924 family protein [Saliniramus fredricksonii]
MNALAGREEIIAFWEGAGPEKWFTKDEAFDAQIRERFLATYEAAAAGELAGWAETAHGTLALLILLDQFPRNMFRGDKRTYATDSMALAIAEDAVEEKYHQVFKPPMSRFFILPFTHAEDRAAQERSVALNEELGDEEGLKWARHHRDIIARFGRFPHRNAILGRTNTLEEEAFLKENEFRG